MTSPRTIGWLIAAAALIALAAFWGSLPALDSRPLARVAAFAAMGVLMVALVFLFPRAGNRRAILLLAAAGMAARLVLLPAPHSDDVHRYLWEARLVLAGESPYQATADDPVRAPFHDADWERLNHPDRPTAYPPGALVLMAAAAAIDDHAWTMKALALLGDLLTAALLFVLLARERAPPRWAGFYLFNPIVLIGFAAEAHFDSLMTAALLGALLAHRSGRPALTWLCLGLGIQIKVVVALLAPLLLTRNNRTSLWVLGLVLLAPSLPFVASLPDWWRGLVAFGGGGQFNAPLVSLLDVVGLPAARPLATVLFAIAFLATLTPRAREFPLPDRCLFILGALILCSPVVHFWYLAWLLPLAVLRPSFAWTVASITAGGYFLAWRTQDLHGWWGYHPETAALLWLPVFVALAAQHRSILSRLGRARGAPPPEGSPEADIGVVIPTLDSGPDLEKLVHRLREELPETAPLVVVRADPAPAAPGLPARILHAPLGRGHQIAAGIAASDCGWIVVVHGDASPPRGWYREFRRAIRTHPHAAMLVAGQRFDRKSPATLLVEALNELRVVFGGVAFGDQTMILNRAKLEAAGGFPDQPLMEDVEVSLRLQGVGRVVYLGREWLVSGRKWTGGFARRFALVIRLTAIYQLVRLRGPARAAAVSRRMYGEYYGDR